MKTIYLDYRKAEKVDLEEYYKKYDRSCRTDYALVNGSPTLIRIEGTVTYLNDLPSLTNSLDDKKLVTKFLRGGEDLLLFKWNRDGKYGRV